MGDLPGALASWTWEQRYRFSGDTAGCDADPDATLRRVATAVAAAETVGRAEWAQRYRELLDGFRFIPGGRILAGAGTGRKVTLLNCFVMGRIEDSIPGIFRALEESAVTLQQGGGIGCDFSTLRPRGSSASSAGTIASGPVSFMHVWNATCATVLSSGGRRGAMMATLRCDHPDVLEFIDAKRDPAALRFFNLSLLVTDDFLAAVREDRPWPLVFPAGPADPPDAPSTIVACRWPGQDEPVPCRVYHVLAAREIWRRLLASSHACSEPGVLFADTLNRENNLSWLEDLTATNPCGELPLPPYGACDLGSINLVRFVRHAFTSRASLDMAAIESTVPAAVRFLDAVLDVTHYPLPQQSAQSASTRRIGLGVTGLADALIMLNLRYDGEAARALGASTMRCICEAAYRSSAALAEEKGCFPAFDRDRYLASRFVQRLGAQTRDAIARHGVRNSHLTAIAPAGTISLLAGNVSSGIEPVFELEGRRRVLDRAGEPVEFATRAWSLECWRAEERGAELPPQFVTATELHPEAHLLMQAALQPWVDGAISKTVNLPTDYPLEAYQRLFERAHALGLKGCTTFRPGTSRGQVVSLADGAPGASRCCVAN
jgi:ribonucleoside-diphosphate reductase alpha chain